MEQQEFKKLVVEAIKSFEKQGTKSATEDGACLYKSPVGCCIVGWMMPDDYVREMADAQQDSSILSLWLDGVTWASQFSEEQVLFMKTLQDIHDGIIDDVCCWVEEMKEKTCMFFGEDIKFEEVL